MTEIPTRLVEIGESFAQRYQPVLDFEGWRVAMLRRPDDPAHNVFHRVERHRETNEVFILTVGQADLIVCDGDATPGVWHVIAMRHNVAYNIGKAVWHEVVMSAEAHIIIFERTDTTIANSDYAELPADTISAISALFTVDQKV